MRAFRFRLEDRHCTGINEGKGIKVGMAQQHRPVYPSAEFVKMPPAKYKFRYLSEKRDHGTITIKVRVNDYEGPVKAVLACVTADDDPPMPHPNMVTCPKNHGCPDSVCTIQGNITKKKNELVFKQIGILRVTKDDLEAALRERTNNTDFPFVRGYDEYSRDLRAINLTRLRFACQVLTQDAAGALRHPLGPVVTTLVTHYSEKLKIIDASHDRGAATGGLRVFLFTAMLPNSVDVVFRERDSDWRSRAGAVWQHKKVALQFTTPPYLNPYCHEPVKVYYFMTQTMDNDEQLNEENRRDFTYLPITDEAVLEDKIRRKNFSQTTMNIINGVETGDAEAAAVMAAAHQHAVGLNLNIPPLELHGGAFLRDLYQNLPEHDNTHPLRDESPLPPEVVDFVIEYEPQAMEVDTAARHYLEQPLLMNRELLEQPMEVDVPGNYYLPNFLPPQATNNQRLQEL